MKSCRGKPPELAENSKIVIERITLGGMLHLTDDNDWPPWGLKVPPQGSFTLGEVQAMSWGGIKNNWQENMHKWEFSTRFVICGGKVFKKWTFPLDLLFLLDYTHYHGDWWLYLAEDNVWPPRGLIWSLGDCFTLGEVQAMSRGGIIIFGRKIQKVAEFSTRFFMSALLHTLPWWLVAIPRRGQWLATPRFKSTSPRLFYPLGEEYKYFGWKVLKSGNFH